MEQLFLYLLLAPVLVGMLACLYSRCIMTAGSSKPDLVLVDSTAYLALYELISPTSSGLRA